MLSKKASKHAAPITLGYSAVIEDMDAKLRIKDMEIHDLRRKVTELQRTLDAVDAAIADKVEIVTLSHRDPYGKPTDQGWRHPTEELVT